MTVNNTEMTLEIAYYLFSLLETRHELYLSNKLLRKQIYISATDDEVTD